MRNLFGKFCSSLNIQSLFPEYAINFWFFALCIIHVLLVFFISAFEIFRIPSAGRIAESHEDLRQMFAGTSVDGPITAANRESETKISN